jgi:RNA polymerase sigma-70 factor (ECF subfamily)
MSSINFSQQVKPNSSSPPGKKSLLSTQKKTDNYFTEEEVLVKNAQKNIKEFEKLYNKHYEKIFRYVYQRVVTKQDAMDVTSQVFLKAMTKINQFKFMGFPFSSWLYRIAKSETYQFLKDKHKNPVLNVETIKIQNLAEEVIEKSIQYDIEELIPILENLEEKEVQLIEMRFFEERSFKEIAEILDISENNAKVKTHRVIKKIKDEKRR